ncbi:hypothetical protein C8Q76DRAFT_797850 [Earliella scabrosa]|nr:hypothetical protein C8Q76DRAFT_797850 [Earliella scabrosa]
MLSQTAYPYIEPGTYLSGDRARTPPLRTVVPSEIFATPPPVIRTPPSSPETPERFRDVLNEPARAGKRKRRATSRERDMWREDASDGAGPSRLPSPVAPTARPSVDRIRHHHVQDDSEDDHDDNGTVSRRRTAAEVQAAVWIPDPANPPEVPCPVGHCGEVYKHSNISEAGCSEKLPAPSNCRVRHLHTHLGITFVCPICQVGFARQSTWNDHLDKERAHEKNLDNKRLVNMMDAADGALQPGWTEDDTEWVVESTRLTKLAAQARQRGFMLPNGRKRARRT